MLIGIKRREKIPIQLSREGTAAHARDDTVPTIKSPKGRNKKLISGGMFSALRDRAIRNLAPFGARVSRKFGAPPAGGDGRGAPGNTVIVAALGQSRAVWLRLPVRVSWWWLVAVAPRSRSRVCVLGLVSVDGKDDTVHGRRKDRG